MCFLLNLLICYILGPLKLALMVEAKAWEMLFGKSLQKQYKQKMDQIVEFEEEYAKRLHRPIKDLEDVRQAMTGLEAVRQNQIHIDMSLGPIEVGFSISCYIFPLETF